jgi:hypothetical protein
MYYFRYVQVVITEKRQLLTGKWQLAASTSCPAASASVWDVRCSTATTRATNTPFAICMEMDEMSRSLRRCDALGKETDLQGARNVFDKFINRHHGRAAHRASAFWGKARTRSGRLPPHDRASSSGLIVYFGNQLISEFRREMVHHTSLFYSVCTE